MNDRTHDQRFSVAKNVALWVLQILAATAFLLAGFAKLSGQPERVETFDKVGVGQWFRYLTGVVEVASAMLLLIPRLTPLGAALLVCTMTGAVLEAATERSEMTGVTAPSGPVLTLPVGR